MDEIQELKTKLQEIISEAKFKENCLSVRDNIHCQILDLLDKYGLGDLEITVMSMQHVIDKYFNYVPINYEETSSQIYIGPFPDAHLKDKLAWMYLTNDLKH